MPSMTLCRFLKHLPAYAALLAVLLTASLAAAYGSVKWKSTRLKESESGGSWHIDLTINLPSTPDLPTIPAKFKFQQKTVYERYLDDAHKDKPVVRKIPTPGKQPVIEGSDIGFLDPSLGKIQKRTRFSFKITRGHGFEAGEYQVTITDTRKGAQLGGTTRLILEGDNPVVDRRSMIFASEDPGKEKKKKEEEERKKKAEMMSATGNEPEENEEWWPEVTEEEEYGRPPPEEEKPGGCGCRSAGGAARPEPALLALGLLGVVVARRRRRAQSRL
jgi:MYXO-CTERM domain-containing protein